MIKDFIFIEDDEEDFWLYEKCLQELKLSILATQIQNFNELKLRIDDFSPESSLVFVDLNLGGENGLSIYQRILKPKGFLSCVLSSSDNPKEVKDCLKAGFWFYASKDVNLDKQKVFFQSLLNMFSLGKANPYQMMKYRGDFNEAEAN